MGQVGNKEAITENKVTAAVEIEKLHVIPAFLFTIPPKRERFCLSVLKLKTKTKTIHIWLCLISMK